MVDIVDFAAQIDATADQLLDLLKRRADLTLELQHLKKEWGLEIYSPK